MGYVAPTICGGLLLKGKWYKRREQKNIYNKAVQTKIHLYINKYIVENYYECSNYSSLNFRVCVRERERERERLLSRCMELHKILTMSYRLYVYVDKVFYTKYYYTGLLWGCPWCHGYRRRIWTRRHEFKSWTRLIAFHIALIPLGKVWIQTFSLQLWVNSKTD